MAGWKDYPKKSRNRPTTTSAPSYLDRSVLTVADLPSVRVEQGPNPVRLGKVTAGFGLEPAGGPGSGPSRLFFRGGGRLLAELPNHAGSLSGSNPFDSRPGREIEDLVNRPPSCQSADPGGLALVEQPIPRGQELEQGGNRSRSIEILIERGRSIRLEPVGSPDELRGLISLSRHRCRFLEPVREGAQPPVPLP